MKKLIFALFLMILGGPLDLIAHCQMPCGIYNDAMVYDRIDQYIETDVKGISVMMDNKFQTLFERNQFMRWIIQRNQAADDVASLITKYFLQQKIKPDEPETAKRLQSAHKMLFLLVQIKQNPEFRYVNDFYEEWERFKLMFHIEDYKCKVYHGKLKKWIAKQKAQGAPTSAANEKPDDGIEEDEEEHSHDHSQDHGHSHEHDHTGHHPD